MKIKKSGGDVAYLLTDIQKHAYKDKWLIFNQQGRNLISTIIKYDLHITWLA